MVEDKVYTRHRPSTMRYYSHFLIKAEGGAKNYKRDHSLPLAWQSFTVAFVQQKGYYSFQNEKMIPLEK